MSLFAREPQDISESGSIVQFAHNTRSSSRSPRTPRNFTWRALIVGLLAGTLINLCNMYYGLQTGAGAQLPTVSSLLGYRVIGGLAKFGYAPLSKAENVLVVSAATATGCMPATAGFTEVIPALEYVLEPKEGGPFRLGWMDMATWSLGLSFFGILFAALLRDRLISATIWPWPGATASANVINALHSREKDRPVYAFAGDVRLHNETGLSFRTGNNREEHQPATRSTQLPRNLGIIWVSAALSALFVSSLQLLPCFPLGAFGKTLFGRQAAKKWLWTFSLSPGFFGSGMIMGPEASQESPNTSHKEACHR